MLGHGNAGIWRKARRPDFANGMLHHDDACVTDFFDELLPRPSSGNNRDPFACPCKVDNLILARLQRDRDVIDPFIQEPRAPYFGVSIETDDRPWDFMASL